MTSKHGLFPLLLGGEWQQLSAPVKRMHGDAEHLVASGVADVEGSQHWIIRLLRRLLGLPSPGRRQAVEVTIERSHAREIWTRRFTTECMRSTLYCSTNAVMLCEQLGPITLHFALTRDKDAIDWQLRGVRLFRLPMPRFFFGSVSARCSSENGRYAFQISTRLPLLGQLVAYRGWLEVVHES